MAKRTKYENEGAELLVSYWYGNKRINVYGCWDKETPENEFDFYDLYEDDGKTQTCINEGEPFWEIPTYEEVEDFINQ